MIKNEKGITILILVITIIVLMLLATITLNFSLGEEGLFKTASKVEFLEDISALQRQLDEREVVARANGQTNERIEQNLRKDLEKWIEQNEKYEEIEFEFELNEDEDRYILTYVSGATEDQEQWLWDVNFPGGKNHKENQ